MRPHTVRPFSIILIFTFIACVASLAPACGPMRTHASDAGPSPEPGGDDGEATIDPGPSDLPNADDADTSLTTGGDEASAESQPGEGESANGEAEAGPPAVSTPVPPFDPGDGGVCSAAPGPGDLIIDELMIASVAGTGDHGEWLEVTSTLGCALDLRGLRGSAPNGSKVQSFDIGDDVWIPALGTFVVADSSIAAINHDLPGVLVVWSGQPGDVLRNPGGTATLQYGDAIVDSVTYPSMTLTDGASLTFARDCPPGARADWTKWQPSSASWFPGFRGTPNAPNDDVRCP
jgi:hypothetical protein